MNLQKKICFAHLFDIISPNIRQNMPQLSKREKRRNYSTFFSHNYKVFSTGELLFSWFRPPLACLKLSTKVSHEV